ncbi:type II toxin-antitoxin system VapC family toxin [Methylotuvimicrobium buryatense]|uniref:PIN domain-containing protein n=1 Tax=Methylotuvimicrobium buryatense TaxID=95641 RepID=A0A4P9UK17_METBY|nr:type II toxin-antitoxin system VapC family toxin [Methylotuvimicrobium buryatense]QCW81569.1 PIN domain-containing protein [Methylotuvimicrobium buryatense]
MTRLVYLDTCCVIYLLEEVQPFSALIRQHLANNLDAILCVSPLVRLESLVKPSIDGNQALVEDYEIFLADQQWLTIDDNIFTRALNLRIKHKIKTPDALHLATAIENHCTEFWTNDSRLNEAAKHLAVNLFQTPSQ